MLGPQGLTQLDAISLMHTNLYGPGDKYHPTNSHVLPALIRRFHEAAEAQAPSVTCWGTCTPLQEFLHVDDLGAACVFALEHWQPGLDQLQFLNVGTGINLSIPELAEAVAAATGFQGEICWDASKPDCTPKKTTGCEPVGESGLESPHPAQGRTEKYYGRV